MINQTNNQRILDPLISEAFKFEERAELILTDIDNAEATAWFNNKITQAVICLINSKVYKLTHSWASGSFTSETDGGTAQLNAGAIGQTSAYSYVLDVIQSIISQKEKE